MTHTDQLAALKRPLPETLAAVLALIFADRYSTTQAMREHHGRDESRYDAMLPDAVIFAHSTEEVAAAVKLCAAHGVPVIAWGSGTSLEGHVLALQLQRQPLLDPVVAQLVVLLADDHARRGRQLRQQLAGVDALAAAQVDDIAGRMWRLREDNRVGAASGRSKGAASAQDQRTAQQQENR